MLTPVVSPEDPVDMDPFSDDPEVKGDLVKTRLVVTVTVDVNNVALLVRSSVDMAPVLLVLMPIVTPMPTLEISMVPLVDTKTALKEQDMVATAD